MSKLTKWVLGVLLGLCGVIALLVYVSTRRKEVGRIAVRAIEAAYRPRIQAAQARVTELEAQLGEDAVAVQVAKIDLATSTERLEQVYSVAGLSIDDVAERLRNLKM